jgi:hypothetical protein
MTPDQISKLITEDPDVINEDIASLTKGIHSILAAIEQLYTQHQAEAPGPWSLDTYAFYVYPAQMAELSRYFAEFNIDAYYYKDTDSWSIKIHRPTAAVSLVAEVEDDDAVGVAMKAAEVLMGVNESVIKEDVSSLTREIMVSLRKVEENSVERELPTAWLKLDRSPQTPELNEYLNDYVILVDIYDEEVKKPISIGIYKEDPLPHGTLLHHIEEEEHEIDAAMKTAVALIGLNGESAEM